MSIAAVSVAPVSRAGRAGRAGLAGRRTVRLWLHGLACLVVLMVAVGGATRLTGSGLSITEWRPVTGAVPPLSEASWAGEFERYRASSQYRNLNRGMELGEFKEIYWWEWSHRQLGRLLGLYFFGPLVWFWWTGAITAGFAARLSGIGALGALQATVGWIMVASGLQPGMVAVAPVKLTLHLLVASLILACIVWTATGLRDESDGRSPALPRRTDLRAVAAACLGLAFVQVALGGLVAGAKAGLTYNTWPLMDGWIVPPAATLFAVSPALENFVDNPALVQFNHRLAAYLLLAALVGQAWWWRRTRPDGAGAGRAAAVAAIGLGQAALGVTTLLLAVPLWAGLAHQLVAMALLAAITFHLRATRFETA